MHATNHPPHARLGVNNWLIVDEDGRILAVRVKLYCVAGTVQDTIEFLDSRVEFDYYVAVENGPPELRFDEMVEDADDYPPAPPVYLNDPRIEDNWCLLFGHATTLQLMNLPSANFLEFEGTRNAVYRATAFMLGADDILRRLDVNLDRFVQPLPR